MKGRLDAGMRGLLSRWLRLAQGSELGAARLAWRLSVAGHLCAGAWERRPCRGDGRASGASHPEILVHQNPNLSSPCEPIVGKSADASQGKNRARHGPVPAL